MHHILLYGVKCWFIKKAHEEKRQTAEMKMLRSSASVTILDKVPNVPTSRRPDPKWNKIKTRKSILMKGCRIARTSLVRSLAEHLLQFMRCVLILFHKWRHLHGKNTLGGLSCSAEARLVLKKKLFLFFGVPCPQFSNPHLIHLCGIKTRKLLKQIYYGGKMVFM